MDSKDVASPETYIGYAAGSNITLRRKRSSKTRRKITAAAGAAHGQVVGAWCRELECELGSTRRSRDGAGQRIVFRFHARRFTILVFSGHGQEREARAIPREDRWDGAGSGSRSRYGREWSGRSKGVPAVSAHSAKGRTVEDRTFEIEFLDPGVQAFAFTFRMKWKCRRLICVHDKDVARHDRSVVADE